MATAKTNLTDGYWELLTPDLDDLVLWLLLFPVNFDPVALLRDWVPDGRRVLSSFSEK